MRMCLKRADTLFIMGKRRGIQHDLCRNLVNRDLQRLREAGHTLARVRQGSAPAWYKTAHIPK